MILLDPANNSKLIAKTETVIEKSKIFLTVFAPMD